MLENKHESASPGHKDVSSAATEVDHDAGSKVSPDEDKKAVSLSELHVSLFSRSFYDTVI